MRILDPVDGGVVSDGITIVPSFVKTGELFEKLKLGTEDRRGHPQIE